MGFFRKFFDPLGIYPGGRNYRHTEPLRRFVDPARILPYNKGDRLFPFSGSNAPDDPASNTTAPDDTPPATTPTPGPAGDARNDPNFSRNAPRIVVENGQTYLTEHGNRRLLQGDEIARGTAYADEFWQKFPTGFQPGVGPQTNAGYDVKPPAGTTPDGSTVTTGPNQGYGTGTGWNGINLTMGPTLQRAPMTGFNDARAAAGEDPDSVKDAFYRWVMSLDFDPRGKSKDEIDDYLTSQMENARKYGINISDVQGENILVNTKERGNEWVDTIRSAGATGDEIGNVAWQWGAGPGAGNLTAPGGLGGPTGPTGQTSGGLTASALESLLRLPGGQAIAEALAGNQNDQTLQEIIDELNRVLLGRPPSTPNMPIPLSAPSYQDDSNSLVI